MVIPDGGGKETVYINIVLEAVGEYKPCIGDLIGIFTIWKKLFNMAFMVIGLLIICIMLILGIIIVTLALRYRCDMLLDYWK